MQSPSVVSLCGVTVSPRRTRNHRGKVQEGETRLLRKSPSVVRGSKHLKFEARGEGAGGGTRLLRNSRCSLPTLERTTSEKPTYGYQSGVGECLGDLITDETMKLLANVRNAVGNSRYVRSAAGEWTAVPLPMSFRTPGSASPLSREGSALPMGKVVPRVDQSPLHWDDQACQKVGIRWKRTRCAGPRY